MPDEEVIWTETKRILILMIILSVVFFSVLIYIISIAPSNYNPPPSNSNSQGVFNNSIAFSLAILFLIIMPIYLLLLKPIRITSEGIYTGNKYTHSKEHSTPETNAKRLNSSIEHIKWPFKKEHFIPWHEINNVKHLAFGTPIHPFVPMGNTKMDYVLIETNNNEKIRILIGKPANKFKDVDLEAIFKKYTNQG